jgi:hypothetical protein
MLSPKAMNRETDNCGGLVTETVKEQLAVWLAPDPVAVHPTVDVPTGKEDPDAGVQPVWIGAVPPVAVGAGHDTAAGWPWNDTAVWGAGQVSVSCAGGGVGLVGESPHPAAVTDTASARLQRA